MTPEQIDAAFSHKQIRSFAACTARINIFEGSVRSGKSYIANWRFLHDLKLTDKRTKAVICAKSQTTCLENIIAPLNNILGGVIKYNHQSQQFRLFERDVRVVGANDERSEGKIRGDTFSLALVDEVSILPQSFFKMLMSRLSVKGAKLIGTTNPDSPYHWLKADYIDRASELNLKTFKFTLNDNPSLDEAYKRDISAEYRGLWYKRFILGEWCLAEGSIYDFFDEALHVREKAPTYAKAYYLGIDYGTTNPFGAVLIGFNENAHPALWVEKEYYWNSKEMGYQKTDSDYALDIRREFGDYPVRMIYLDPSAASFEVELKRHGMQVKQAENDVIDGIRHVAMLICNGDLVICKPCVHLIKEFESYVWDEKAARRGEDAPIKRNDHLLDSLRYVLYTHFGKRFTLKPKGPLLSPAQKAYAANPMAYAGFAPNDGFQAFTGQSSFN